MPDDTDGGWIKHDKTDHQYYASPIPSVTIMAGGKFRFNQAAVQRYADADDPDAVRFFLNETADRVGFEFTDGEEADGPADYSLNNQTVAAKGVLNEMRADTPKESTLAEIQESESAPAPWFSIADLREDSDDVDE